ncbi:hypothetical protein FRC12_024882 [Ceratobasidium sp. 428]|nr:hypothetical protein FRC12_024882 [Ceratobasidium sp. 428]
MRDKDLTVYLGLAPMSNSSNTTVQDHVMDWSAEPTNNDQSAAADRKATTASTKATQPVDIDITVILKNTKTESVEPKTESVEHNNQLRPYFAYKHIAGAFILVQLLYWRTEKVLAYMIFLGHLLKVIACVSASIWKEDLLMCLHALVLLAQVFFLVKGLRLFEVYAVKMVQVVFGESNN